MKRDRVIQLFGDLRDSRFALKEFFIEEPISDFNCEIEGLAIPQPVQDVYRAEFAALRANYHRQLDLEELGAFGTSIGANNLCGGIDLLHPEELEEAKSHAVQWALGVWSSRGKEEDENVRDYRREFRIWMSTVPIIRIGNGDYIGFDARGRVVYLCHDGESFIVAAEFTSFFAAWENVYFVGPEWWMLAPLLNKRKRLPKSSPSIREFRKAFEMLVVSG